jgi:hypothetical protein
VPLTRWQSWVSAAAVTLLAVLLVIGDIDDAGLRHWWAAHALTTDTVAGLLVLMITLLVADQVVRIRQARDRSRAVGAQAAILMAQASRSSRAVAASLNGSGDHDAAFEELRTYMIMLLVGAPVLIDARLSRNFLEQAQRLAAEMARSLSASAKASAAAAHPDSHPDTHPDSHPDTHPAARLDEAMRRLRAASAPLLQPLTSEQEAAVSGDPAS